MLALLVVVLLVVFTALGSGAVAYAVHRSPTLNGPVMAGVTTVAAFTAILAMVVAAGGGNA
ncbi:hypothetical protein [Streptomyces globisporus]|uniref:hypothetical protein n=1 Tax=Streptomyces globisporus TaxID=1908 RepID=UPI002F918FF4|nr:hypothetical protein OG425_35065 [Streptomyces globisporus]WSV94708.1 hypothetical protein OG449_35885 [Streptomyces globisporus]